jgi:hypothetical protein
MKIHRAFFLIAAIWDLLRFFAVFLAVWIVFRRTLETNNQGIYWLLVLGNGGLLTSASLLFLYVDPEGFRVLLNLVRLGKILGLFSALLLIVVEPVGTGLRFLSLDFLPYRIAPFSVLLVVSVVDLIFLFLLFSYEVGKTSPSPPVEEQSEKDPPLPDYRKTAIR